MLDNYQMGMQMFRQLNASGEVIRFSRFFLHGDMDTRKLFLYYASMFDSIPWLKLHTQNLLSLCDTYAQSE